MYNEALFNACQYNNWRSVKRICEITREQNIRVNIKRGLNNACKYGSLKVIKWLYRNEKEMFDFYYNLCCSLKHKKIVKWMINNADGIDVGC